MRLFCVLKNAIIIIKKDHFFKENRREECVLLIDFSRCMTCNNENRNFAFLYFLNENTK